MCLSWFPSVVVIFIRGLVGCGSKPSPPFLCVCVCVCVCVCEFVISQGGSVERFHVQWNVISVTVRPCVCLQRSSVVSMTWLIVLLGLRAWLTIITSQRAPTLIWPVTLLLSSDKQIVSIRLFFFSLCSCTSTALLEMHFSPLLMTEKPNCQLKIRQNKHSRTV